MKDWFLALCTALHQTRSNIYALVIVIGIWMVVATWLPRPVLDIVVYGLFGWYVIGDKLIPWAETKISKLLR